MKLSNMKIQKEKIIRNCANCAYHYFDKRTNKYACSKEETLHTENCAKHKTTDEIASDYINSLINDLMREVEGTCHCQE